MAIKNIFFEISFFSYDLILSQFLISINFRNCLGSNDNPNAVEFSSAFKKLLVCHPLITSVDHNVLTNATGILTVSSHRSKKPSPPPVLEDKVLELELDYEAVMIVEIEKADPYEQHLWAYVALCVEEKFVKSTKRQKNKCSHCANILLSEVGKINDELLAMKDKAIGQIQQPSMSTLKIVIFGNAVMRMYSEAEHSGNGIHVIRKSVINSIDFGDLFSDCDFSHRENDEAVHHKAKFISLLIETFMALKSHKICKKITDAEKGEMIRHKRKRAVILKGQ